MNSFPPKIWRLESKNNDYVVDRDILAVVFSGDNYFVINVM